MSGLDRGQADAVTGIVGTTRPVVIVVGPAGAGKTRMLAAAVDTWRHAGVHVFGVGPLASSAQQLADGAGTATDTLHKLVYEQHTKWIDRRQPPDREWALPVGSVVTVDEAGMVDTRLLHQYAQIAQRNRWRTILVGDYRQLDPRRRRRHVRRTRRAPRRGHRRTRHTPPVRPPMGSRRITPPACRRHGCGRRVPATRSHPATATNSLRSEAVVASACVGIDTGRDVLVMAPTNRFVEQFNQTITDRLLATGTLDPAGEIDIGGHRFYVGQPVVTRANDRRLTYGQLDEQWVRNGDRWTVLAGHNGGLDLEHHDTGDRTTLPADYVGAAM